MDEKQLKALRIVEIDETRKEQDYLHVQQKLRKQKRLNWRVPAVVLAACTIFFIMWLTSSPGQQERAADGQPEVKQILVTDKSFIPKSRWYQDVREVKDPEIFATFSKLLEEMKPIDFQEKTRPMLRIRYKLMDGTVRDFEYRFSDEFDYLHEVETGINYELSLIQGEQKYEVFRILYYDLIDSKESKVKIVGSFILLIAVFNWKWRHEKKMIKETGLNSRLPLDSSIWQSICRIIALMFVVLFASFVQPLHFGVLVSIFVVHTVIIIAIERAGENNRWRIQNYAFLCALYLLAVNTTIYHLFI